VIRAAFVAELAKLSEEQQRVILPNGKRAVYLDRIGWGLTYLKLWGAVDSPRRGQQVIPEKGAELFCNIRKVFRLRLLRRSFVPPVKQVPNLAPKIPFKHLKTTLTLFLLMLLKVLPKSYY
jgi:restriction endonuclease